MFKNKTYENVLNEILDMAPDDIDTRQGSVFFNHVAPVAFMISRYYTELQISIDLTAIDTCEGIYLDEKSKEHAVYRIPAQHCIRNAIFVGDAILCEGMRFFADNLYFKLIYNENKQLVLEAEIAGEGPNAILAGTELVPVNTVFGLTSAKIGIVVVPGAEVESDENLRRRLKEKITGPAQNGNIQHYKTWCESIEGVGTARIIPLWNGQNTVKAVLVGNDGLGAADTVVYNVQQYIDPGSTGLGEGVANIGAYFTAVSAINTNIDISFNIQLINSVELQSIKEKINEALVSYFKKTSLNSRNNSDMTIRSSAISNIIYDTDGVIDYSDLKLNGTTANIIIPYLNAPKLGVLTIEQI